LTGTPAGRPKEQQATTRGPQEASVLSEAAFRSEHPVIIGLISMLVGTDDPERVEATYRRLWMQGIRITTAPKPPATPDSPIIRLFQCFHSAAGGAG
jgi:hypothetical protein